MKFCTTARAYLESPPLSDSGREPTVDKRWRIKLASNVVSTLEEHVAWTNELRPGALRLKCR
jgi:hypothetical protein